jgi:hypothetical protein
MGRGVRVLVIINILYIYYCPLDFFPVTPLLSGTSRDLAELLKRRKINMCYVQKTMWKREKANK